MRCGLLFTQPRGPARSRSDQRYHRWHLCFCTLFYEADVHLDTAFEGRSAALREHLRDALRTAENAERLAKLEG